MHKRIALAVCASALVGMGAGVATASSTLVGNGSPHFASGLPPYWHKVTPSWCYEDMPCWIGSITDDRSDTESYVDWQRVVKGNFGCMVYKPAVKGWRATCIEFTF